MARPERRITGLPAELLAEMFGTFILIMFGVGVVAQVVASGIGDHDSITWSWGFGVMLGVYVAGKVSGAHLNPAVTVALACFAGFEWRKVAPYAAAQTVGAFLAALLVRWNYTEAMTAIDPGHTVATQGIFSTLPGNGAKSLTLTDGKTVAYHVSQLGALRDQIIGTAVLVFLIFAITSVRATPPMSNLAPLIIGLLVVAIGMAWGADAGYAINPARDFGPRLASYITGFSNAWKDQNGDIYFWVPIVGPLVGGVIGGAIFKFGVEPCLPPEEEVVEPSNQPEEPGQLPHSDDVGTSGRVSRT